MRSPSTERSDVRSTVLRFAATEKATCAWPWPEETPTDSQFAPAFTVQLQSRSATTAMTPEPPSAEKRVAEDEALMTHLLPSEGSTTASDDEVQPAPSEAVNQARATTWRGDAPPMTVRVG